MSTKDIPRRAASVNLPSEVSQSTDERVNVAAVLLGHDGNLTALKTRFITKYALDKIQLITSVKRYFVVDDIDTSVTIFPTVGDKPAVVSKNAVLCAKAEMVIIIFDPSSSESINQAQNSMQFVVSSKREAILQKMMRSGSADELQVEQLVCLLVEAQTEESTQTRLNKEIESMVKKLTQKYPLTQSFLVDFRQTDRITAAIDDVIKAGLRLYLSSKPEFRFRMAKDTRTLSLKGKGLTDTSPSLKFFSKGAWNVDLSRNHFVTCSGFVNAKGIKRLNLSSCKITDIAALTELVELVELNVSNNKIDRLPESIKNWKCISVLNLSANRIKSVEVLASLTSLQTLDLSDNVITYLPVTFASLNLAHCRLKGNPIVTPPKHVVKKGFSYTKMYLQGMIVGTKRWDTCKVVIVGPEGVGKTYLSRRLMGEEYNINLSTDGIAVSHQSLKSPTMNRQVNFAIYDFGGQEVFYPTHQFFLTGKCLYIIVFNITNPQFSRIEYWLRTIRYFGGIAPKVIVIGTHLDLIKSESELAPVKKKLSELKHIVPLFATMFVSCKTKKNISEFKEKVIEAALSLPILKSEVPESYLVASQIIQEMRKTKSFISWKEFCAAFHKLRFYNAEKPEDEIKVMAEFMNDIGIIGWYNPSLNELVILDNQWLASIMATIVSFKVRWKDGIIPHSSMSLIWKRMPAELHDTIRAILERFEIIFPLKDENPPTKSIAPCMLPLATDPEYQLFVEEANKIKTGSLPPHCTRLIRRLNLGFLPLGFFSRLIVRLMHEDKSQYKRAWLNGIILASKNKNSAGLEDQLVLEYDDAKYTLTLTCVRATKVAQGSDDLFGSTLFAINSLIDSFYVSGKDNVSQMIICTHCMSKGIDPPAEFDSDSVIKAFMSGATFIKCPKDQNARIRIETIAPDIALSKLPIVPNVEILDTIAQGGFGTVYLGKISGTDEFVAVKELRLADHADATEVNEKFREFKHECYVMSELDHQNLVKFHGILLNPLRIVMEFCGNDTLHTIVTKKRHLLTSTNKLKIALQIAEAMSYLHSLNPPLIHRDLRTPNIFVVDISPNDAQIRVGDFGLSIHCASKMTEYLPTFQWLAPEVFDNSAFSGYDESSDVYSYGMCLYELLTGVGPFQNETDYILRQVTKISAKEYAQNKEKLEHCGWRLVNPADLNNTDGDLELEREEFREIELKRAIIHHGFRPRLPEKLCENEKEDEFWRKLIIECWMKDPKKRPTFPAIVERITEWIKSSGITIPETPTSERTFKSVLRFTDLINRQGTVKITDAIRKKARKEFNMFDISKTGYLDRRELKRLLRRLCRKHGLPPPTKSDVAAALEALDANGDGVISFEEFLEWFAVRMT